MLDDSAAAAVGLIEFGQSNDLVVMVISHDCDLAQEPEVEPDVEVIAGRRIDRSDGNFTHAKNPRRLHLAVQEGGNVTWIELVASRKRLVAKAELANHQPRDDVSLLDDDRTRLQLWLAARYRRTAFPDEFENRLAQTGLAGRLQKILTRSGHLLLAVFFEVDEGVERSHNVPDDPYTLGIYLVYDTASDPTAAEAAAYEAATQIESAFRSRCFDSATNVWREIELLFCQLIADEALTFAQSLKFKRWNADHISLRDTPQHPLSQ
jgi:hypothetical protein